MKLLNTYLRKVFLISAVLLITIALGTGVNKVFAGQGIESLITSWFDSKRDVSINQMDEAITSEKERLMEELREAIRMEMQRSDAELAKFRADETALRLSMLQNYAENLIGGLHIDLSAEKANIIANLDAALAEAMTHLDSSIIVPPPVSTPTPDGEVTTPDLSDKDKTPLSDDSTEVEEVSGEMEDGTIEEDEEQGNVEGTEPDTDTGENEEIPSDNAELKEEIVIDTSEDKEESIDEEKGYKTDEGLASEMEPTNL